jgi:hypothetical protein
MKTVDEFILYLDSDKDLAHILQQVDRGRVANVRLFVVLWVCSLLFVIGIAYLSISHSQQAVSGDIESARRINHILYVAIGIFFVLSAAYSVYGTVRGKTGNSRLRFNDFASEFKDKVIRRMVVFCNPGFRYEKDSHITLPAILQSDMLVPKNYDISGSDLIQGVHEGVTFRFSDVRLTHRRLFVSKGEDRDETVFMGSIFIAGFNKKFKHPVFVYPRKTKIEYLQKDGDEVRLESPSFAQLFRVYSPDQIEARYILSTSLMARIEQLAATMGNQLHIVFAHNSIYIANNNGVDRIEVFWSQSVRKRERLLAYYRELVEQLSVIEELKLNIKIWY